MNHVKWLSYHKEDGIVLLKNYQRYRNVISNASGVLFRKNTLKSFHFESINYKYCGDWIFWNQLILNGKVVFIPEPLNKWRIHENTTRSIRDLNKDYNRLKENKRVINFTNKLLNDNSNIDSKKYSWILIWWLNRYSYKNLFRWKYIFGPLPSFLISKFYLAIIKRTIKEGYSSTIKKIKR